MANESVKNNRYISPLGAWALSLGSAVGWGAFVMPGTTFIPIAGPFGTAVGMAIGTLAMLIIAVNYQFLMTRFPEDGGTYSFVKKLFGHDHAFLTVWFLSLTYIAIIWANVTALALISRTFFGDLLQFGFHYSIAGYTIYLGESLLELVIIALITLICIFSKKSALRIQIGAAVFLVLGVLICILLTNRNKSLDVVFANALTAQQKPAIQFLAIAAISPWAFVGFENISHSVTEFKFPVKKTILIMTVSVVTAYLLYTVLTMLAIPYYGVVNMPVFYLIKNYVGNFAYAVLGIAVLAGILTGIIGNAIASSRLLASASEDKILPEIFGKTDSHGVPRFTVLIIFISSALILFLGRSPIGWIVDVTTIGATIAYGYTSASAIKLAKSEGRTLPLITGIAGLLAAIFFSLYLLVPNFWSITALAPESYILLALWSVFGFLYFRQVFIKDSERKFGKSTVVWIALLFLIFFTSIMWMRISTHKTAEQIVDNISLSYTTEMRKIGVMLTDENKQTEKSFLSYNLELILDELQENTIIQFLMIMMALGVMFSVFSRLKKREEALEEERIRERRANEAKTTFLSNMSHDIRTPMNAIVGYTKLARKENVTPEQIQDFLAKIDSSSKHLLALINDVLEMSRIESGKMELEEAPTCLSELMNEVCDIFATQMMGKQIDFTVDYSDVRDLCVICDRNRINRVLLNLVGNAYKFTPEGGKISVILRQTGEVKEGSAPYELRVKDNGIGMSKEFAERVFEAFERERTSTVSGIQGTGLGMTITKSIVDLIGGEISVNTEKGKGTEFVIEFRFLVDKNASLAEKKTLECQEHSAAKDLAAQEEKGVDFRGRRLLLVDDVEVNREIAAMILQEMGFEVETAGDGKKAVEMVASARAGHYDAVLMDIQMPEMDGYEATKKIRELSDDEKSTVPIVAMTANAFEEDRKAAFAAGMNAHIAKPVDEAKLISVLESVLM